LLRLCTIPTARDGIHIHAQSARTAQPPSLFRKPNPQ